MHSSTKSRFSRAKHMFFESRALELLNTCVQVEKKSDAFFLPSFGRLEKHVQTPLNIRALQWQFSHRKITDFLGGFATVVSCCNEGITNVKVQKWEYVKKNKSDLLFGRNLSF